MQTMAVKQITYDKPFITNVSCVAPNYIAQQDDINERIRAILIDWLIEVHDKFDLMHETMFLTVNLIDRFLAKQNVIRKKLQLVGLVAMLLAYKYEEVSVPVVGDLILISDKASSRNGPTPYVFMRRFLKAAEADKKVGIPEHLYKNRLQEYAHASGMTLPSYETTNEGSAHAPKFWSTVLVGGNYYTSRNVFSVRKAAEQDAAKLAYEEIVAKIKDEGLHF
ncbi:hypothetical protein K1719_046503 [Acacia pycnantha]|nr:hypothetical protein K1719_046503 [Acacia pycnantha]